MKFKQIEGVERESLNGCRFYKTPEGTFPSITTVLSAQPKAFLDEWRNNIGEDRANKITRNAANRGTQLHKMAENYLSGLDPKTPDDDVRHFMPMAEGLFRQIKPELDKITDLYCLETFLYSKELGIAGTVDCVGVYDGILSVIDFKTARSVKDEKDITDYFIQCAAYAIMCFCLYKIIIKQAVVLIAVEGVKDPQVFKVDIRPYAKMIAPRIEEFWKVYNNKNNGVTV